MRNTCTEYLDISSQQVLINPYSTHHLAHLTLLYSVLCVVLGPVSVVVSRLLTACNPNPKGRLSYNATNESQGQDTSASN